jgi:RND family efflux transporter MFP subunit
MMAGMATLPHGTPPPRRRRLGLWIVVAIAIGAAAFGGWRFASKSPDAQAARKGPGPTPVMMVLAESRDVPVRITANGTVAPLQSVELRAQVTSTVREVRIREGQNVARGDLLFSLDARLEEANVKKAEAQVEKDRADLATAQRNLARQRELFNQKFISQAALDQAQNAVDTLKGQMAVNVAAVEGTRAQRGYMEIRAPFSGRTGAIAVRAGSQVQPGGAPLVTIAQVDPLSVSFTLPERELAGLQRALAAGPVKVTASPQSGGETFEGRITFVDNAVETATGTIRVKAEFANPKAALWPGMYVNVELSPRTIAGATVVPPQAVQTGPENRFVYVVGEDRKVVQQKVELAYVEEKFAVVQGLKSGSRVVVEGAQNLRPGSSVVEASTASPGEPGEGAAKGEGKSGKKKGKTE